MRSQAAVELGAVLGFGEQGAAVAIGAQWLGGKEAGRGGVSLAAKHFAVQRGAEALGEIVQQKQFVLPGD